MVVRLVCIRILFVLQVNVEGVEINVVSIIVVKVDFFIVFFYLF